MQNKYLIIADFTKNTLESKMAKLTTNSLVRNKKHVRVRCLKKSISTKDNLDDINFVLQFNSPDNFVPILKCRNYGFCDSNTKRISPLVDCQIPLYDNVYDENILKTKDGLDMPFIKGDYVFCTANEDYNTSSTNILIEAFVSEFLPSEPVSLIIKTNRIIDDEIEYIKSKVGMYPSTNFYKQQIVINGEMPRDDQLKFINTCDCYVETADHLFGPELKFLKKAIISSDGCVSTKCYLKEQLRHFYETRQQSNEYIHDCVSTAYFLNQVLGEDLL